jgi:microcystin degradation protein MlrC
MRVAIGQLWQETNTFNPLPTTRGDFEAFGVLRGGELIEKLADTNEPGGMMQALRAWPEAPELVGLVRLPAWPSGTATADTFAWLLAEVTQSLERAGRVDAVLLALHGAMVSEGEPDVEGAVLEAVRARLGPDVPLVASLDLHANVTRRMARAADALVLYHTAPHIDVFETGTRAAGVLRRVLADGVRPVTAFQKLPMVVPAERANTQDPDSVSYGLCRRLRELEGSEGVLTAGLATVQPWLDIPEMGSAALVVAETADLAHAACCEMAEALWEKRREYVPELIDVGPAVAEARRLCEGGLVVLGDSADSTTSGSPGDSTHILAEVLRHDWPRPALVALVDPELVAQVDGQPAGARWEGEVGAKRDARFGRRLKVAMEVVRAFDGRFVLSGHLGRNLAIDMGRCAVLRQGNTHVVVTSRSGPHFAPELFAAAGLRPFEAALLVAKSPCGFRAAYAERAVKITMVRATGCSPANFAEALGYRRIPRPLWPWDGIADWRPRPEVLG